MPYQLQPSLLRLVLPLLLLALTDSQAGAIVTSAPGQMSVCSGSSRYQCVQSCYDNGQRLVTIKDLDTNNRVKAFLLGKRVDKAYVGMDDQAREGYFQRTDGSVYVKDDFNRWASATGGPEQLNEGDDCVTVDSDGNWRVESCSLQLPSVCEGALNLVAPTTRWTAYCNSDRNPSDGDNENINFARVVCGDICNSPLDWKCRVAGTAVSASATGQNFSTPCSREGIVCDKSQNSAAGCNDYEVSYLCPADIDECALKLHNCDPNAECLNTPGSYVCQCKPGFSGDGFQCRSGAVCSAFGGAHVVTFDGAHQFGGSRCDFQLAENCNSTAAGGKYLFSVESRQDLVGGAKIFVVGLLVKVYDLTILAHSENGVTVNGMPITPSSHIYSGTLAGHANSSVSINYMWNDVVIITDYGLRVAYDMRRYLATVFVPRIAAIQPCGLCGNADGHQANDFTARGASSPSADKSAVYASWMTASQSNANCKREEVPRQAESSSLSSASVSVVCNAIIANYAFSSYLSDATLRGVFNDACHSDMSAPFDNQQLCQLTTAFYRVLSARGLLNSAQEFPPGLCNENSTCRDNEQLVVAARPCEPNDCATIRQGIGSGSFCGVQLRLPSCQCRPGYRRSGNVCVRANDCGCSTTNSAGGAYKSKGQVWYTLACARKNTCNGANSVESVGNECRNNSRCVQLPDGAAYCDCAQGFAGPGCEDIDECAKGSHACHANAVCVNTQGGYQCRCQSGYQGNGYNCSDIDECSGASSPCSANAICRNLPGGFQCACVSPYVGDGKTCSVPFIAPNYANASSGESGCSYLKELHCDASSVCSDLANGSISCVCPHGSIGDGYKGAGHTGCSWPNCPANYTGIEGFCYYYDTTKRNHSSAAEYCATLGGTLVTLLDDRVASQVKVLLNAKLANGNFWTGYADDKTSGYFPPMDFVGSLWRKLWLTAGDNSSTGSGVGNFRPDLCGSGALNNGAVRLQAKPCSEQLTTVCKVPGASRSCPEGWQSLGDSCYYMSDEPATYEDAMVQCALLGADLVSIKANDVSKFLYDYFFNSRSGSGYHWIGLQFNTLLAPNAFAWWNAGAYNPSYLMWESSGEPAAGKDCAAISTQARWATRACGDKLGYICQKQRWAYFRCPGNAYYFNGKCYTVIATSQNFTRHLDDCRSLGGDLIAFQTVEEYKFFSKVIYTGQTGPRSYYTGLFLAADAANFTNSDGSKIVYHNWKGGSAPSGASAGRCTQIADPAEGFSVVNCSTTAWAVCEFENTPCLKHSDCAANGECFLGQCRCRKGFYGDGKRSCVDIDECKIDGACQAYSTCTNLIGSYRCDCNAGYQLNAEGRCQDIRYCVSNSDCLRLAACVGNLCTCNRGYQGDGVRTCVDIDECLLGTNDCSPNATCTNNPGSFDCTCKNGFAGDGRTCVQLPRNCHELRLRKISESFPKRSKQTIDPDGTGPLDSLEVTCEMYADYGITVFPPEANEKFRYSGSTWREKIIYTTLVDEMTAVVVNSAFCIQTIRYNCFYGANPMEDMLYYDRSMKTRQDWGSGTEGKCLCGTVGLCRQKSASCNCNGDTSRGSASDYGYVTNRDLLPLRGFRGRASRGAGEHVVGELRCSGVQFDIPATCDDHPDRSSSNVHLIDPDQRGELSPFPALCFNPFCNNAFIGSTTVVSHDNFGQKCSYGLSKSITKGDNPITYCAPLGQLQLLKTLLSFCSQEIRYDCSNSPLVSAGNEASHFYTAGKRPVPNMGFGSPGDKTCPCSALNKCANGRSCNCDNTGSGWTYDFGWVLNKDHLPITGINAENIGPASAANVSVGYFACSARQFGIMGNCQMYRTRFREDDDTTFIMKSYTDNYVYPIDPDLKGAAIQPFPAYCSMKEFDTGVTIIPNLAAGSSACSNTSALCETKARYFHTKEQIAAIASRSTYCSQAITYRCRQSPLLLGSGEATKHAYWKSLRSGANRYDFGRGFQTAPDGGVGCGCAARGGASACGSAGLKCACDAAGDVATSEDIQLDDKDALPVESMFVSGKENYVEFGDMICYDVSESCVSRYRTGFNVDIEETCVYQRLGDLYLLPNQYKGGFNPIPGRCNPGGETEIQIVGGCVRTTQKDVDPVSRERCYNIQYYSAGVPINNEQVSFLARQSSYCIQYARYMSKMTPFSGNVRWTSLYGGQFSQWAGTQGRPGCACGIAGVCQREGDACNTDRASSDWSEDRGWFVNFRGTGDLIPMTQLCTKLGTNETAETQICLDSIRCMDSTDLRIPKDCQDIRDGNYLYAPPSSQPRSIEPWIINPYGGTDKPPALATCDQSSTPPIGVTIVGHKTCGTFGKAGGLFNVSYHGFPRHQLDALIQSSTYCTQRVEFKCRSAAFSVTSSQGANDKGGGHLAYWGDNAGGSGCKGGACKCDGSADWKDDDGLFTDKSVLPLSSVRLDPVSAADSERKICVHELRCYKVYPDCNSYYLARGTPPYPNGRGELAVDPDQAGPLEPFSVACDIAKCPDRQNRQVYMGISRFYFGDFYGSQSYSVDASAGSAASVTFNYVSPDARQAAALADRSSQCWQLIHAYSQRSGLLGAGARISDRSGARVVYFSGSDVAMATGCACRVLGTCANDSLCHSDETVASQSSRILEGTYVINKAVLPITGVSLPSLSPGASLQVYAETLRCAPNFCGLPKHCSEVSQMGRRTSFEQWIQPGAEPFLVLCVPGQWDWSTRVVVDKVTRNATGYTSVTYKTATPQQLADLVRSLTTCTQAVKVTCSGYRIMSNPGFALISATGQRSRKFVSGEAQCACGDRVSCQGASRAQIDSRVCNCDIADNVTRYDSGVLMQDGSDGSGSVPIIGIDTAGADTSGRADWQLSDLFCGKRRINLDECALGLHDCDPHADCAEAEAASITCTCQAGWRGLGVPGVVANGRQCFDDDECALGKCGANTACVNLPGSFRCDCQPGYRHSSPTQCVDIDECATGTHNCDTNARCINTEGSFICVCLPNYEGSGRSGDCREVGTCMCWGEPHCRSFDERMLHFQGACSYTLARDGCTNGKPTGPASFEVVQKNWRKDRPTSVVTWTKEILVRVLGKTVILRQGMRVVLDGQLVNLPAEPLDNAGRPIGFTIRFFEGNVLLTTRFGLYVKWNGDDRIEVKVEAPFKRQMCGLCGDFDNSADNDWILGPFCKPSGNATDNARLFGDSWRTDTGAMDGDECQPGCSETPDPVCVGDAKERAKTTCAKLREIFSGCAASMAAVKDSFDTYIDSCVFDTCLGGVNICQTATTIAAVCQSRYNSSTQWRRTDFCPMTCGENQHYDTCAAPCQPTCVQPNVTALMARGDCAGRCTEACVCNAGYVMTSGRCVLPSRCGCQLDGLYYNIGDMLIKPNCTERCNCTAPGSTSLTCSPYRCHQYGFCGFEKDLYDCHCKKGFHGNGVVCDDDDECAIGAATKTGPCSPQATCRNTIGSYNCTCNSGWRGDGRVCDDIDECDENKPCNATTEECFNLPGSYECRCQDGFVRNSKTKLCDDKDECKLNQHSCHRASTSCRNTYGRYECDCKTGYTRVNQYKCKDINECADVTLNTCHKDYATCTNTPGSYKCTCHKGFTGNGTVCEDVDECKNPNACYMNATCTNTVGSFYCTCDDGNRGCTGPDPCLNVKCNGTQVYCYRGVCYCERGFVKNVTTGLCEDENECNTGNNNCTKMNALCLNTFGSYECQCLPGYVFNPVTQVCEDIDECLENRHDCKGNARCVNTDGGYQCQCQDGFMGHCEECRDIDECEFNLHLCDKKFATCNNTIGSYICTCNTGFIGNGKVCVDIDECCAGSANCPARAACINTPGSFKCQCSVGYVMSRSMDSCEDENECLSSKNDCSQFAKCINNVGSYTCQCLPGYSGDGVKCTKDNTKLDCNGVSCHPQATCNNATCVCLGGFEGNGVTCTDIDECVRFPGLCDKQATCYNTPGSYACQCRQGLSGDGKICYNETNLVTPCMRPDVCNNGICTDLPQGKHKCECRQGFQVRQDACVDIDECEQSDACASVANSECKNKPGSFICACRIGYEERVKEGKRVCVSVDQCARNSYLCGDKAQCVDVDGGYQCVCKPGHTPVAGSQPITCANGGGGKPCKDTECPVGAYCKSGSCQCLEPAFTASVGPGGTLRCVQVQDACIGVKCPANSTCQGANGGAGCVCNSGLHFNQAGNCVDIRECDNPLLNDCDSDHGRCVELVGGYRCECADGYRLDSASGKCVSTQNACKCGPYGLCLRNNSCWCRSGYTDIGGRCVDVDECSGRQQPCHRLADCINTAGSYRCECPTNYDGDGYNFCDLNECKLGSAACASNARCINTLGSYRCECPSGYIGDGKTCIKGDNPCLFNNGGCGSVALCSWADQQITCQCPAGYRGSGFQCYDINECMEGTHNCDKDHAICTNNPGSFYCLCKQGYMGDGVSCRDVNECATGKSNCHQNAKCSNTDGSFSCACKPGYRGDGVATCDDVGDCRAKSLCDANARCVYTPQGYACACNPGYQGNGYDNCRDIDECASGTHKCVQHANCRNTPGSYACQCGAGFVGDGRTFCNDINECLDPRSCAGQSLTVCVNLPGGFSCPCAPGAQLKAGKCEDINECDSPSLNRCHSTATCTNTQGSYSCACRKGYIGDGIDCQDVDECLSGTANCDKNALCVNTPGSFDCRCSAGLLGNGTNCDDVDECDKNKPRNQCHELATCINQNPGYSCVCPPGYSGSGFFCAKRNPCSTPGLCSANATCYFDGTYTRCICKSGYVGNGRVCLPDNSCTAGTHTCDLGTSTCVPRAPVGFDCECKPGFHKEGNLCVDNDECDPASPYFRPGVCGDPLISKCTNSPGGFNCLCTELALKSGVSCIPLDVCNQGGAAAGCHPNANCEYLRPGHRCICKPGYTGDGKNCTDIDECRDGTSDCYGGATCKNLQGSYRCDCPKGLVQAKDPRACVDFDECTNDPLICGNYSRCVNTRAGYTCECVQGWAWNPEAKRCEDVDECKTGTHPCHSLAECTNTPGSCTCHCRPGYHGDGVYFCELNQNCPPPKSALCPAGSVCRDQGNSSYDCRCPADQLDKGVDSCASGVCVHFCQQVDPCWTRAPRCSPFAKCQTVNGAARCVCLDGFSGNGIVCDDVNECAGPNQCNSSVSSCRNLDNRVHKLNYTCDCVAGYENVLGTYQCVNINECDRGAVCSANSKCVDTPGSYRCECDSGFRAVGPRGCVDIDECAENADDCNRGTAECVNLVGSFACRCKLGLEMLNRTHCQDVNECATAGVCGPEQTCHNTFASYACSCPVGYTVNGVYCVDIDECSRNDSCHATAMCNNTRGSYQCYCPRGKRMSLTGACEHINECSERADACPAGALCVDNTTIGFACACPQGYMNPPDNQRLCQDIDECSMGMHNCTGQGSQCVNTMGGFTCKCQTGFAQNGADCVDIDECKLAADAKLTFCQPGGSCVNTPGSFVCNCPDGYEFRDTACANIDECALPSASRLAARCPPNQVCVDTVGSFRCYCPKGFTLESGNNCVDIDECKSANACPNGICTNTAGNYTCTCSAGYRPDGPFVCVDIDECAKPDACGDSDYGVCLNRPGSFNCSCKPGSAVVDAKCRRIDECVLANVTCPPNSHCVSTTSGHRCDCNVGFRFNDFGQCVNEDECGRGTSKCDPMAECTDTVGSYTCSCRHGYQGDGRTCTSVCQGACEPNQMCRVTEQNTPECTCDCVGKRCLVEGQVCDNRGRTHASEKAMFEFACKAKEKDITVSYFSPCKEKCSDISCPESHICVTDPDLKKPICKCRPCTDADKNSGPVCTHDLVQFSNRCDYIKYKCYWKDSVSLSNMSVCRQPINCKVSEWSQWGGCSRTCGIGFQVRTRSLVRESQFNGACPFDMTSFADCYSGPCPDGPCRNKICPTSHICVEANGTAVCRCPSCDGRGETAVCGVIGNKTDTFKNLCELEREACEQNASYIVHHQDACGKVPPKVPAQCSLVYNFQRYKFPDGCESVDLLPLHKCDGGCGNSTDKCCVPLHRRTMTARYKCPDNSVVIRALDVNASCDCQKKSRYVTG